MFDNAKAMGCLMPVALLAAACAVGTMAHSEPGAPDPGGVAAAHPDGGTAAATVPRHFLGTWEGKGQLFGKPAVFRMEWSSLGDRFLRLEFSNAFAPVAPEADPIPVIQAAGFYRVETAGTLSGRWFDSRGTELPLAATVTESLLVVEWGTEESAERGRTSYRWTGPGTARVTDEVLKDGEYRVFATADYWRVDASASSAPSSRAP